MDPWTYAAVNASVGVAIATDAVIATLCRFHRFPDFRAALKWAGAIGLTHWIFPLFGFIGGWYLAAGPAIAAAIYLFGGALMTWFVIGLLSSATHADRIESPGIGNITRDRKTFWVAVWVVSIDALVSGAGKTSATASWSEFQIWMSFPFVGLIVFSLVILSTYPARRLYATYVTKQAASGAELPANLARFFVAGTWVEIAIFSYFGLLSVAQGLRALGVRIGSAYVWMSCALLVVILALRFGNAIASTQHARAALTFRLASVAREARPPTQTRPL